jgi:alkylhydroperoxidase family enzyme
VTSFYHDATPPVRADLDRAHRETVEDWAAPGNHWSGAERLAMAAEVRRARAADELPPWVAPTTVDGLVDGLVDDGHPLPPAAVDAVWRLAVHPGSLTSAWYDGIIGRGLSPERYVELVSVVATACSLEVFAEAIGVPSRPLPGPVEGEPDGEGVPGAAVSTHWVPTVPGRGANVTRALTAVPAAVRAWRRLSETQYVPADALLGDLQWSRGALDRRQVELLAARTSLLDECFY